MRGEDLEGEDQLLAEEAFAELYRRHAEDLLKLLGRAGEGQLYEKVEGTHALSALVDDTFLRACDGAESYDPNEGKVGAWLVGIARNLVKSRLEEEEDRLDGRKHEDLEADEIGDFLALYDPYETLEPDPELMRAIRDALAEALTARQWELLMPYLALQASGDAEGRANRGEARRLADRLGTTPQNLRTTKHRAFKRVREYLSEHMPERVED